jgi:toxin-antitoxin system PIN domain toxin
MPAAGAISLADANVWLALTFSDHVHHTLAKTWFDAQSDESCAFCRLTQMAILRHLTNSNIMGEFVQNQQDAWKNYDMLAQDPRVIFFGEPPSLEPTFRNLSQAASPLHHLWTDAYLAAFALANHSRLVTFDQGFRRFPGLDFHILAL